MSTATALNYKPASLISAVEFPMGWGEGAAGINAACTQLGLKTIADVHEYVQTPANLQQLGRLLGKAAKTNYLTSTVKKVCEGHDDQGNRKPVGGFNNSDDQFARKAAEEKAAPKAADFPKASPPKTTTEEPDGVARWSDVLTMTRPEGVTGRAAHKLNRMDRLLELVSLGTPLIDAKSEVEIGVVGWRRWLKEAEFSKALDYAQRIAARTHPQDDVAEPDKTPGKPDTPAQDDGDDRVRVSLKVDKLSLDVESEDDEPFPPFPIEGDDTAPPKYIKDHVKDITALSAGSPSYGDDGDVLPGNILFDGSPEAAEALGDDSLAVLQAENASLRLALKQLGAVERHSVPGGLERVMPIYGPDGEVLKYLPIDEWVAERKRLGSLIPADDYHTRKTDKLPDRNRLLAGQIALEVVTALGTKDEPGETLADVLRGQDETLARFLGEMEEMIRAWDELPPFVEGLMQALPKPGSVWDDDGRNAWLNTASSIFVLMYRWPADAPADDEAEDPEPAKAATKKRKGGK